MGSELSNSAKRVQEFLSANGFSFEVRELPSSTSTAQKAADSIGCTVPQIAKSLVFKEEKTDHPILFIAHSSNRVDVKKPKTTGFKTWKSGWKIRERKSRLCNRRCSTGGA